MHVFLKYPSLIQIMYNFLVKQLTAPLAIFRHFAARHSGIGPASRNLIGRAPTYDDSRNFLTKIQHITTTKFPQ